MVTTIWTDRSRKDESNASWTVQFGVKTNKLWAIKGSGKTVIRWNLILNLLNEKYVFQKRKCILWNPLWTAGSTSKIFRGLFNKITPRKGYRPIRAVRSKMDGPDQMGASAGPRRSSRRRRHGRKRRDLAGVTGPGDSGHHLTRNRDQTEAELDASLPR